MGHETGNTDKNTNTTTTSTTVTTVTVTTTRTTSGDYPDLDAHVDYCGADWSGPYVDRDGVAWWACQAHRVRWTEIDDDGANLPPLPWETVAEFSEIVQ